MFQILFEQQPLLICTSKQSLTYECNVRSCCSTLYVSMQNVVDKTKSQFISKGLLTSYTFLFGSNLVLKIVFIKFTELPLWQVIESEEWYLKDFSKWHFSKCINCTSGPLWPILWDVNIILTICGYLQFKIPRFVLVD